MCYGSLCKNVDPTLPIYCPDCLDEIFDNLTEEQLYEMYAFFEDHDTMTDEVKDLFFDAFNTLLLIKRRG